MEIHQVKIGGQKFWGVLGKISTCGRGKAHGRVTRLELPSQHGTRDGANPVSRKWLYDLGSQSHGHWRTSCTTKLRF